MSAGWECVVMLGPGMVIDSALVRGGTRDGGGTAVIERLMMYEVGGKRLGSEAEAAPAGTLCAVPRRV